MVKLVHRTIKSSLFKAAFVFVAGVFLLYVWPLPSGISDAAYSRVLYSSDGTLLAARISSDEQWRFPPPDKVPEKYAAALLAYEDNRFYRHPGVDPLAIARALVGNWQADRVVSGGSTITMQLARVIRGNRSRTYSEKLSEILLAFRLEMHYTKDDLMILYAAHAPYGGNIVGLGAASWRYYGRGINDMTWAEAALFAVLPKDPAGINPGKNRTKLKQRRDRLLHKLFESGKLSELDLKLAKMEPLPEAPLPLPRNGQHLLETLIKKYPDQYQFDSTIQGSTQKQVELVSKYHSDRLAKSHINNLAIIVIDNIEQELIAYVGNTTFQGNLLYSPAVDIAQRPRSSGSLFKPFLFAMMLQQGMLLPDMLVMDTPSYYNGYSPENYDRAYRGVVTAKQALIESLNVPAVRLLKEYGVAAFKDDLQGMGLTTLFRPADDYGLALIIGGAETSLWEIAGAYSGLALSAYGYEQHYHPVSILKNEKHAVEGKAFPVHQGAAWLTLEALTDLQRPDEASAWKEFSSSQKIAWKTGTSYGWHDAWSVGVNGRYTVAVWAGNANSEEGRDLTGSKAAAPVMLDIFRLLPDTAWPETPLLSLQKLIVCAKDGYLKSNGCALHETLAPIEARFERSSPFHQLVYIDDASGLRVHGMCQPVSEMRSKSYFVLPPVAEHYYQKVDASYEKLPPWRKDCLENLPVIANDLPMQLEYPSEGARIRIPVELDGKLGRSIFRAQHRLSAATLYWHLDDQYLGETSSFHEKAIVANPGWHRLILVDNQGYQLERWFKVL